MRRSADDKWSDRRSLAFLVLAGVICWANLTVLAIGIGRAILWAAGRWSL